MKILKPGKVEIRKFVCEKCGCVFVANEHEHTLIWMVDGVGCPTCYGRIGWEHGEPYEEPVQDANAIERLADLIYDGCTTDGETAREIARHLSENGVTFREDQHG